ELGEREDLLIRAGVPAHERKKIEYRFREITFFFIGVEPDRFAMLSFGELLSLDIDDKRQVRVDRAHSAYPLLDEYLPRSVRDMVFSPDDMGDAHLMVVDDDSQVVERVVYRSRDHEIAELSRIELDRPADHVIEHYLLIRILESDHLLSRIQFAL